MYHILYDPKRMVRVSSQCGLLVDPVLLGGVPVAELLGLEPEEIRLWLGPLIIVQRTSMLNCAPQSYLLVGRLDRIRTMADIAANLKGWRVAYECRTLVQNRCCLLHIAPSLLTTLLEESDWPVAKKRQIDPWLIQVYKLTKLTWIAKSPLMVPGSDAAGFVSPDEEGVLIRCIIMDSV